MTELVLPENVAAQLQGIANVVNLCDASGKKLGCFVPAVDLSEYEILGPEPTEEELRQAEMSNDWFTTDEVLRRLEKLG
jgi:hypothetical protein